MECGLIDALTSSFDQALDWRWQAHDSNIFTANGGDLVMHVPEEEGYYSLDSSVQWNLTGRSLTLELDTVPPGVGFWFDIGSDQENYAELFVTDGGQLLHVAEVEGVYDVLASEPYDPVEHRFLRLREQDGSILFGVSADGQTFNELLELPLAGWFDPRFVDVFLGFPTLGGPKPDLRARFVQSSMVNSPLCKAETLSDNFNDGVVGPEWNNSFAQPGCALLEQEGRAQIACPPEQYIQTSLVSSSAYDLTGSSVRVEPGNATMNDGDNVYAALILRDAGDTDSFWFYELFEGSLVLYEITDADWQQAKQIPYLPEEGSILRVREHAGQVIFERSVDGVTFTNFISRTPHIDISKLQIELSGGVSEFPNPNAPVEVWFDNLNVAP